MNILVSYHWIKEFVKTDLAPEEFAARLSLSGPGVERWRRTDEHLDRVVVGEILNVKPHPNADKLRIAETNVGNDVLRIVCGGSNLKEGMKVAVALLGAKVKWHGEGDLVELKAAEIRGVKSGGMISAANEIGLFDYFPHAEREILDLSFLETKPGIPLGKALNLDDVIFDIEVTSNRPDAFSVIGLAREASAILPAPFLWKESKVRTENREPRTELKIEIQAAKLCPRYQAAALTNVMVKPSPWWMQRRLLGAGIRPISNIVDITNYVMLELGQPLHAFDADRLQMANGGLQMVVRNARAGETIKALDGKTYSLDPSMLVIANAKQPVAIAGIMGGQETGITEKTKTIIFESANFDPVSVRRSARKLNLQSDSSLRFEKGLSTEATAPALGRVVELAAQIAGATQLSALVDRRVRPYRAKRYAWNPRETEALIGVKLPEQKMKHILEQLGFKILGRGKTPLVAVPYWRDHDIESGRDFAEEIARVYGYHALPSALPSGTLPGRAEVAELTFEDHLRDFFLGAGFTETYSYSLVSRTVLERARCGTVEPIELQNPLTAELARLRTGLAPSLLEIVSENQMEFPSASIFEIANLYEPRPAALPNEMSHGAAALWGESENGELFFKLKGLLELLGSRFRIEFKWGTLESDLLHPGRRTAIMVAGKEIGFLGEVHPQVRESFGIKPAAAILECDLSALRTAAKPVSYAPITEFPSLRRDISFVVPRELEYRAIIEALTLARPLLTRVELFDVYEGSGVPEGKKSMAFHLSFSDSTHTLTGEEGERAFNQVVEVLKKKFHAEVRI